MLSRYLAATALVLLSACTPDPASPPAGRAGEEGQTPQGAPRVLAVSELAAGAYLAEVGGCHDCHTPGWAETGHAPDDQLLAGVPVGFAGPWGTSYPANLRNSVQAMSAEDWTAMMRTRQGLPPMPWAVLNQMSDEDLRALYTYIHSLGEGGNLVPAAAPPGTVPSTPFIWFNPMPPEAYPTLN